MRPSRQKFAARILFFVLIAAGMTLPGGRLLAQGGEGPPFGPVRSWPELPAGWSLGEVTSIAEDHGGHIWVFNRSAHPLLEFTPDGRFVRSIAEDLVETAHGLIVDKDDHLYFTDGRAHVIRIVDVRTGKVLTQFGSGGSAAGEYQMPHEIILSTTGDLYIADLQNRRVQKLSPRP